MATQDPVSLSVNRLTVERGGRPVIVNGGLLIPHKARMALVGPNGVGKSTLLAALAGRVRAVSGSVSPHPPSARIGLLEQELPRRETQTARMLVAQRVGVAQIRADFETATRALADGRPGAEEQYEKALNALESAGGFDFDHRLEAVALDLGLATAALDQPTAKLSGGQLTKVGLASIVVSRFDITLLDEPTNNLDRQGLEQLENWLSGHGGPVVLVSHDRSFLDRTINSVARLVADGFDPQRGNIELFSGSWADFEQQAALARKHADDRYDSYVSERERLKQLSQQKREWADRGMSRVKKRPADNDRNRRQYELAKAESQIGAAKAVSKRLERLEVVQRPWQPWELRFSIAEAGRSSSLVVVVNELALQRGDFRLGPLTLTISWGDRLAIDGPNGSGKTTLIEGLFGRLEPISGSVAVGPSVITGTVGQLRNTLFADRPLLDVFVDQSGLDATESRSLLAKFGLDANAVLRQTSTLSPGQRTRAELALFQASAVNLIVLDEPTNHLDMEAIEQLEQALDTFDGTLVVISHDQRFRQALRLTRTIEMTELGDGGGRIL